MVTCFFLDTSAIVKRYKVEVGTIWLEALVSPGTGHRVILSEITVAEVAAALAAMQRASGGITKLECDQALDLFLRHCATEYELIAVNRLIIDRAVGLTQTYKLRGCDSIQLATALVINETLMGAGFTPLTFIAADDDLLTAAQAEQLTTENPNLN